jgi:hypothetical protein
MPVLAPRTEQAKPLTAAEATQKVNAEVTVQMLVQASKNHLEKRCRGSTWITPNRSELSIKRTGKDSLDCSHSPRRRGEDWSAATSLTVSPAPRA